MKDMQKIERERLTIRTCEDPTNGENWLELARFLRDNTFDTTDTVSAFEKAQVLLPHKDLHLQLGLAFFEDGRFDEGLNLVRNYLKARPTSHGYCLLSNCLSRMDQNEESLACLIVAMSLDETFEETYYLLGEYFRKSFRETALLFYRKAIAIDPNYQLAYQSLGSLLASTNETVFLAIEALEKSKSLNLNDAWTAIYLANSYWRVARFDEADKEYRRAISIDPEEILFAQWYGDFLSARPGHS